MWEERCVTSAPDLCLGWPACLPSRGTIRAASNVESRTRVPLGPDPK